MNVKKLIVFCLGMAALMALNIHGLAQAVVETGRDIDQLSFKNIAILGKVVDEQGNPVPNIKLELELAPEVELKRDLNLPETDLDNVIKRLKVSVGSGIFTTVTSDEKGEYKINGVPIPGVYYLFVRNVENYLPTRIKLFLNASEQEEYEPQDLILRARKGGSPGLAIPEKALKEVEKARKAMEENDNKKAVKYMLKALEIEPNYAEGHYNLAVLYMSAKKRNDAISHLEKAAQLQENYKPALKTLGELYLFNKDYEKAVNYLIRYMTIREKEANLTVEDVKFYFQIANAYRSMKHVDKAIPYYEQYINAKERLASLDQKDSLLCSDVGSYYYTKKNLNRAIIYYKKAVELNPGISPATYMYLGNCYAVKRDGKNALIYYQKYLELEPGGQFAAQVKNMVDKLKPMYTEKDKEKEKQK